MVDQPSVPASLDNDVTDDGVFHAVRDGYDAVYDTLGHGETFNRIWRGRSPTCPTKQRVRTPLHAWFDRQVADHGMPGIGLAPDRADTPPATGAVGSDAQ